MPLGKAGIRLFFLQIRVKEQGRLSFLTSGGNYSKRKRTLNSKPRQTTWERHESIFLLWENSSVVNSFEEGKLTSNYGEFDPKTTLLSSPRSHNNINKKRMLWRAYVLNVHNIYKIILNIYFVWNAKWLQRRNRRYFLEYLNLDFSLTLLNCEMKNKKWNMYK